MHPITLILASLATTVTAAELKVNFYADDGCSDFMISTKPNTDNTCYNYNWNHSNSVNIADCTFPNGKCVCTFYTKRDCSGSRNTVTYGRTSNCASAWGQGFSSIRCAVVHEPWLSLLNGERLHSRPQDYVMETKWGTQQMVKLWNDIINKMCDGKIAMWYLMSPHWENSRLRELW